MRPRRVPHNRPPPVTTYSGWEPRMRMAKHAVVIVGSGPTGMMLAAELALANIDVAVVERRAGPEFDGSRSRGMHARTIEVLDQRGIADRFLAEGEAVRIQGF